MRVEGVAGGEVELWRSFVSWCTGERGRDGGRSYKSCVLEACFYFWWERVGELRVRGCGGGFPIQGSLLAVCHCFSMLYCANMRYMCES